MIVLDTNILSELMRPVPERAVLQWMAAQAPASLFTTSVTQAEMMLGVRLLPAGKRRARLEQAVVAVFDEDFSSRVLAFDRAAVPAYVEIVAGQRSGGRPITQFDAQIAAIARVSGAALATRNTADFEGCGLMLIDPWQGDA